MKTLPVLCCGPGTAPLDPEASETLAARFRALSDPTRVAIVNRLASTEECCVCDLNAAFELSQPTISHHLKVLRDAGLVESSPPRHVGLLPARARRGARAAAYARRMKALFVCVENAGRSQIAQALYERRGGEARSAGSRPAAELHEAVVEALEEVGIDVSGRTPTGARALRTSSGPTSS